MVKRLITWTGLLLLAGLAACQPNAVDPNAAVVDNTNPVEWDRNPTTIVFRADVTGGSGDSFLARNEVPACTIYGDNHIVWIIQTGTFESQVLEDRLTDEQMRRFINYVALNEQFYSYPPRQDNAPASSVSPVVETLTLFVNNVNHQTDAFSGWDFEYYQRLVDECHDISIAPVLYVPTAAYVSAEVTPYDPTSPTIVWDAAANGLSLAELAASGERRWTTDRNVAVLWEIIRTSPPSVIFDEGDIQYHVALDVPLVTRNSPSPP